MVVPFVPVIITIVLYSVDVVVRVVVDAVVGVNEIDEDKCSLL